MSSVANPLQHFSRTDLSNALEEHDGQVSLDSRIFTNLRFADYINALGEEEQELEALVVSLGKTCTRYKMEISAERTKIMTNIANSVKRDIKVDGQKLEFLKQASSTLEQLFQMMALNQRVSQVLHKPLQLLQS